MTDEQLSRRARRERSRRWRGVFVAFGVAFTMALGLVWPSHGSDASTGPGYSISAVPCSKLPHGMPKHSVVTDPGGHGAACDQRTAHVAKRCAVGIGGTFVVGFAFGGPITALSGAAGAAIGCLAGSL
jgi:hypothetical protein